MPLKIYTHYPSCVVDPDESGTASRFISPYSPSLLQFYEDTLILCYFAATVILPLTDDCFLYFAVKVHY